MFFNGSTAAGLTIYLTGTIALIYYLFRSRGLSGGLCSIGWLLLYFIGILVLAVVTDLVLALISDRRGMFE
jgi:hypothetical protein